MLITRMSIARVVSERYSPALARMIEQKFALPDRRGRVQQNQRNREAHGARASGRWKRREWSKYQDSSVTCQDPGEEAPWGSAFTDLLV